MLDKNYHDFVTAHADGNSANPETRELLLHMADKLHEMDLRAGMKSLPPQTPTAGQVKAEADGHAANASRRRVFQSERYFEDKPRQSEEGSWTESDEDFFQSVICRLSETPSTQADAILWLTGFYVSGRTEAGEMTDPAVAATNYLRDAGVTIFPESELQPLKTRKPYVAPSIREIPESELTTDQLANLKVDQVTERDPSPGVGSQDPAGRTPVAGSEVLAEPGQNETAGVAS